MSPWRRMAALALVVAALGLPVNDLFRYALLVLVAVPIFSGAVTRSSKHWLAAVAAVAVAVAGQLLLPAPRIDEGHNIFLAGGPGGALEKGLPAGAFRLMAEEFDARYPAGRRCSPTDGGCWQSGGFPTEAYAFSTDGIYDRPAMSRRVTGINFSDPVWLRLGFINDMKYNWYAGHSDIQRYGRIKGVERILHPWQFTIPYFVAYRFPSAFVGSQLCWQGEVLWEGAQGSFTPWRHAATACRPIERDDVGRTIFGVAIGSPLEMTLDSTLTIQLRRLVEPGLAFAGIAAILLLLVRWRRRQLRLPFILIGLALAVVLLHDAAFIGGVRPFDGGDDGLFYESAARRIVQHVLAGDYSAALEGGEKVFYYGGPGLRYIRALEHFIFGDSFLGYLSLMLALPFVVFAAFKRFLSARTALALMLIFVAIPIGALFGSTYYQYVKWASRGFADPAAAMLFVIGFVVLAGPGRRFAAAFGAGLLFALALWLRPNLAPGAAVLLGGAGLYSLWNIEIRRLAGLCIGFLPVFGMALHNWVFGHELVLFSSNATIVEAIPMPPSAYVAAAGELLRGDVLGEHVRRGALQIARWLAGPSESFLMIPLNALAIAVLIRVAARRGFDAWLRLVAAATLSLHVVALFYLSYDRYYYLNWLLTLLVCAVWMRDEGAGLLRRLAPAPMRWLEGLPGWPPLGRALDRWAAEAGWVSAAESGSRAVPRA